MNTTKKRAFVIFFALLLIISIIAVFFFSVQTEPADPGLKDVVAEYISAYPLPDNWNANPNNSDKYAGYLSYSQKDYSEAMVNFKYSLINNPDDLTLRFYMGVCLLIQDESREAVREFNSIIDSSTDDEMVDSAKWYKSLALLKLNRVSQAKKLLAELPTTEAKKLLDELAPIH